MSSEVHSVGLIIARKAEASAQVSLHKGVALVGINILHKSSIDSLGGSNAFSGANLVFGTFGKESLGVSLLGGVGAGEHLVSNLGDINTGSADLGGGSDGVDLVDALERNAVDLEGATHEEESGFELLEENNALSTEATGSEDKH